MASPKDFEVEIHAFVSTRMRVRILAREQWSAEEAKAAALNWVKGREQWRDARVLEVSQPRSLMVKEVKEL